MQPTQQHLDCPQLVFEMAQYIRPEHFGVLGYMATLSNSVADALQYVMRFSRLVIDGRKYVPMNMTPSRVIKLYCTWPQHER